MLSKVVLERMPSQAYLRFNIKNIDECFPRFALGNFVVLDGPATIRFLSMLLCVRAQLPSRLGGLESKTVFVDGGNTFRLFEVSYIAQLHKLNPTEVLERILISRAFTAHQLNSLVFDKLYAAVKEHESKLVLISDITNLYLDEDVPEQEAKEIFTQLIIHLSEFTEEKHVVVIATCLPHAPSKRDIFFKTVICRRANVLVSVKISKYGQQFVLKKHPFISSKSTYFSSRNLPLTKFLRG